MRAHIRAGAGAHFDPKVVAAFDRLVAAEDTETRPAVLVVDDEVAITRALARGLRRSFTFYTATSGRDALAILRTTPVAAILTDQRMPGMTGLELLAEAGRLQPRAKRLLLTGYTEDRELATAMEQDTVAAFIAKPYHLDDLRALLRATIARN